MLEWATGSWRRVPTCYALGTPLRAFGTQFPAAAWPPAGAAPPSPPGTVGFPPRLATVSPVDVAIAPVFWSYRYRVLNSAWPSALLLLQADS